MRTLLRNVPTGLYVQAVNCWTSDPKQAYDFKTMRQAIGFVEQTGFRQMELAFASDNAESVTTVSVAALRASLSFRPQLAPGG